MWGALAQIAVRLAPIGIAVVAWACSPDDTIEGGGVEPDPKPIDLPPEATDPTRDCYLDPGTRCLEYGNHVRASLVFRDFHPVVTEPEQPTSVGDWVERAELRLTGTVTATPRWNAAPDGGDESFDATVDLASFNEETFTNDINTPVECLNDNPDDDTEECQIRTNIINDRHGQIDLMTNNGSLAGVFENPYKDEASLAVLGGKYLLSCERESSDVMRCSLVNLMAGSSVIAGRSIFEEGIWDEPCLYANGESGPECCQEGDTACDLECDLYDAMGAKNQPVTYGYCEGPDQFVPNGAFLAAGFQSIDRERELCGMDTVCNDGRDCIHSNNDPDYEEVCTEALSCDAGVACFEPNSSRIANRFFYMSYPVEITLQKNIVSGGERWEGHVAVDTSAYDMAPGVPDQGDGEIYMSLKFPNRREENL